MDDESFEAYVGARGKADELLPLIEKLGFTPAFITENVLSTSSDLTVAQVAMLWQGMPNKHDRKRTRQLLDALSEIGLVKPAQGQSEVWRSTVA